jgi:hypothetical protein
MRTCSVGKAPMVRHRLARADAAGEERRLLRQLAAVTHRPRAADVEIVIPVKLANVFRLHSI